SRPLIGYWPWERRVRWTDLSYTGGPVSRTAPGKATEVMDRQRWLTVAALSDQSQFTGAYCFFSAVRSRP
ncbi:hypothetical protein ACWD01_37495, partial [Streptomyces sp. NPDC002835]